MKAADVGAEEVFHLIRGPSGFVRGPLLSLDRTSADRGNYPNPNPISLFSTRFHVRIQQYLPLSVSVFNETI